MVGPETKNNHILISDVTLRKLEDGQELSANINGEKVWYNFPTEFPVRARPEPFLPLALFEAMLDNVPVVIDPEFPLSRENLKNLETFQDIMTCWNTDLNKVDIKATTGELEPAGENVYCCFSGGVDSTYSYARHQDEITHLLTIQGFDSSGFNDQVWQDTIGIRKKFADQEAVRLVHVSSNVRNYCEGRRLPWSPVHGSILACLGLTLNARKLYIPSTFTYNTLFPWGSHPLLDIQWSNENTEIIHDGLEAARSQKTAYLTKYQNLLDHIQVCWGSSHSNCGHCPKCVRTSLVLNILGKSSANLPDYKTHGDIKVLKPAGYTTLAYFDDLIFFAYEHDRHDIVRQLKSMRKKFVIKHALQTIGKTLVGNFGKRIYRRLFPARWTLTRTGIIARNSILDD
ncbi:hypothetical protein [Emcibacter sp.]|uniref:hypothetical protein n=1 Tax=Emcibacter sp. TaxID=1979954 RepID=UPI003A8F9052